MEADALSFLRAADIGGTAERNHIFFFLPCSQYRWRFIIERCRPEGWADRPRYTSNYDPCRPFRMTERACPIDNIDFERRYIFNHMTKTHKNNALIHSYKVGKLTVNVKSNFAGEKRLEDILYSLANIKLKEQIA